MHMCYNMCAYLDVPVHLCAYLVHVYVHLDAVYERWISNVNLVGNLVDMCMIYDDLEQKSRTNI